MFFLLYQSRVASPEEFWNAVERIYGEVPNIIKLILQVNGFNSFLALKGIRYEDKQDFFQSLELTILELLNSDYDSQEKKEVEAELAAQYYNVNSFRLKPGHRNYIMNLMLEIENIDINEFFGRALNDSRPPDSPTKSSSLVNQEYLAQLPSSDQIVIVKPRTSRSEEDKQIIVNKVDHGYSRDDQEQESEFIFEEEYLTDDTMDSISQFKVEYEPVSITRQSNKRRATTQASPSSAVKRRPDHMYNEDFIAKCVNPRRRRVTLNKTYPTTDEGTRERFTDLIQQVILLKTQLNCII